jgi:DNA-binding Xre family transcriptional regulator
MKGRNRNSLSLTDDGIKGVRTLMGKKRLTQDELAFQASISTSTLKRLLNGNRVDIACFEAIISALEMQIIDSHVVKKQKQNYVADLSEATKELSLSTQSGFNFFMTVIFAKKNRTSVEIAKEHLQKLLSNAEFKISEGENGSMVVAGSFTDEDRQHIEALVNYLENQPGISCKVTW